MLKEGHLGMLFFWRKIFVLWGVPISYWPVCQGIVCSISRRDSGRNSLELGQLKYNLNKYVNQFVIDNGFM